MNSKFCVSFEVAKLLKEKGYDMKRDFLTPVYKENGCPYWSNHEDLSDKIPAITKAEAIDWLENKGIIVDVDYYPNRRKWSADICRENGQAYMNVGKYYLTRLEVEEAAIIKACELLTNEY